MSLRLAKVCQVLVETQNLHSLERPTVSLKMDLEHGLKCETDTSLFLPQPPHSLLVLLRTSVGYL